MSETSQALETEFAKLADLSAALHPSNDVTIALDYYRPRATHGAVPQQPC